MDLFWVVMGDGGFSGGWCVTVDLFWVVVGWDEFLSLVVAGGSWWWVVA